MQKPSLSHHHPDGSGRARARARAHTGTYLKRRLLRAGEGGGLSTCKSTPSYFVDIGGPILALFYPVVGFVYWISGYWDKCTSVFLTQH